MASKTIMARTALFGLIAAMAAHASADVVDGGFESGNNPALSLPNAVGIWSGDRAENVTAQDGITPFEGARMIHFQDTTPWGGAVGPIGSELWQIVDLAGAGNGETQLIANAEGWFNRIAGEEGIDTQFSVVLSAYAGDLADFGSMWMNSELDMTEGFAYTDSDVQTWQRAATSMLIPTAADFLVLRITATENVYDDAANEFWGHYGDAISLTITEVPAPASASVLMLGLTGLSARRRRKIA